MLQNDDVNFKTILPLLAIAVFPTTQAHGAIVYTCDPTIDARLAGLCNTLNTTIAGLYSKSFTNASAAIYVTLGKTGLGSSSQYLNYVSYSKYISTLSANATASGNAIQKGAVTSLATYAAPLYSNGRVQVTAAMGRSFGFTGMTGATKAQDPCSQGSANCFDAVVTVTNDPGTTLFFRNGGTEPRDAYDFFSIIQHETNEVLGISSCIDTSGATLTNSCENNAPSAIDMFRYSGAGKLIPITALSTVPGAYFSYDGGVTNGANGIAYNTLSNGSDYHDFAGVCPGQQHVQDAEGCPGRDAGIDITNDGGAEINTLNALGYIIVAPAVTALPSINTGGVVAHGTKSTTIAPGSWVNIYGTNLSTTTRFWNADTEIINGNLPTSLDGVSVKVNGKAASVYFISPGQINIQAPDDTATGTVSVTITNASGTSSSVSAVLAPVGPAIFTLDSKYAAAYIPAATGFYLPGTPFAYDLLGKAGTFAFNTRAVKKGEVLVLYGTGFGPTNPVVPAGKVYAGAAKTITDVTVLIGGVSLSVPAYITGAGVYQFNVTIPQTVAVGDNTLQVIVNGVPTPAGTAITVQ